MPETPQKPPERATPALPSYDELVELLRQAPPREQIVEDRYWAYRRKVDVMLARLAK